MVCQEEDKDKLEDAAVAIVAVVITMTIAIIRSKKEQRYTYRGWKNAKDY
jgi:hypothetical protein